ncbi:MAG TPA: pirin family protein, partial [Polyangiaceae bacterium]|nr:pirin family protein [Polyangiaceae bacterium]
MIRIRPANERGHADHGWLDSHHTFSFADYYDPNHMGFRALRVINDDTVEAGRGFGTHPHRDMEIISYVLDGALQHKDSMGTGSIIRPNDVQRMSAGTGVTHSEFNASQSESVHFLQIWLLPERRGIKPSYEQKTFSEDDKSGRLRLVASPDGREGSTTVHTDALVYAGLFDGEQRAELPLSPNRHAWVQVARGKVSVNGHSLS